MVEVKEVEEEEEVVVVLLLLRWWRGQQVQLPQRTVSPMLMPSELAPAMVSTAEDSELPPCR